MSPNHKQNTHISTVSLRARLAIWLSALFLVCMLGVYVAARQHAEEAAERSYDRLLLGSALSIAETISVSDKRIKIDLPYAALDMLSAAPDDRVFYSVTGPTGQHLMGNIDTSIPASVRPREGPQFYNADIQDERVRFVALGREVARPGQAGWIWVNVGQTRRARNEMSNELLFAALLPIAIITIIAIVCVWFATGWALAPLRKIGRNIRDRQPSDLSLIDTSVPSDIAPLVSSLNIFMRRLEENIETLRAFIADAAHQMRTPLAALRAQAQVSDRDNPDELRRSLDAVERNAEKLTRLLNQLLSDSTVTHLSDIHAFDEFDLRRTIRQCIRESVPMRSEAVPVFRSTLDEAWYHGDSTMLGEALRNVIHNALHHGNGERSGIEVSLDLRDGCYLIAVADRGTGIGNLDSELLFKRFTRRDAARSGSGLGLAIVKRVVDAHGGEVHMANRVGGGLLVEISLPRQPA